MSLPIISPGDGTTLSPRSVKLCCIKLKVKYPVKALINDDGEPSGNFFPVGEKKITEIGDEWGSKGQGANQELELTVLGPTSENMLIDFQTGISEIEIDTGSTTLDPYSTEEQIIELEMSVCFVCCTCLLADGTGKIQDVDDCCKLENFAPEGGGHRHGLGGWRTGHNRDNKECRTPSYAHWFSIGPPDDELKELRNTMRDQFRSDVISNLSRSYVQFCCWEDLEPPSLGPGGRPLP